MRRNGRMLSILVSRNAEGIAAELHQSLGAVVERFPVTLKEIFLEHGGNNKCSG